MDFAAAGLGLDYAAGVQLSRTTSEWLQAGEFLRRRVADLLVGAEAGVEVIGSSSVDGLLAKPIIDLVVGLQADQPFAAVSSSLTGDGWVYRGDDGGQVFVLESRPWHRVAHLHVVQHDGEQWCQYLLLRDVLREDPVAREQYEQTKRALAAGDPDDRHAYTSGKSEVTAALLQRAITRGNPARPTRALEFIASLAAEPDAGRNADTYLAEDFGQD